MLNFSKFLELEKNGRKQREANNWEGFDKLRESHDLKIEHDESTVRILEDEEEALEGGVVTTKSKPNLKATTTTNNTNTILQRTWNEVPVKAASSEKKILSNLNTLAPNKPLQRHNRSSSSSIIKEELASQVARVSACNVSSNKVIPINSLSNSDLSKLRLQQGSESPNTKEKTQGSHKVRFSQIALENVLATTNKHSSIAGGGVGDESSEVRKIKRNLQIEMDEAYRKQREDAELRGEMLIEGVSSPVIGERPRLPLTHYEKKMRASADDRAKIRNLGHELSITDKMLQNRGYCEVGKKEIKGFRHKNNFRRF